MKKWIFVCAAFLAFLSAIDAGDAIGKVLAVEGTAQAGSRALARGASIFTNEVLKVAPSSKMQVLFTDGGILNLIEKTEYNVKSYAFNSSGKNVYSAELLEGGFRALSGSIAKDHASDFNVKTPVATIGIRGTDFEAMIVDGTVYFGCESGQISVSNGAGERLLSQGEYVASSSTSELGEVTTERFEVFNDESFSPVEEMESETSEPADADVSNSHEDVE